MIRLLKFYVNRISFFGFERKRNPVKHAGTSVVPSGHSGDMRMFLVHLNF